MNQNNMPGEPSSQTISDPNLLSKSSDIKKALEVQDGTLSNQASPDFTSSNLSTQAFFQSSTGPTIIQDEKSNPKDNEGVEKVDISAIQEDLLKATPEIFKADSPNPDAETQSSLPTSEPKIGVIQTQKDSENSKEAEIGDEGRIHFILNCPVYVSKDDEPNINEKINKIIQKIESQGFREDHQKKNLLSNVSIVFGLNRSSAEGDRPKFGGPAVASKFINYYGFGFTWDPKKEKKKKTQEKDENEDEKEPRAPMREIRQMIFGSPFTKMFLRDIRDKESTPIIYLMCIDDDTEDFNQVLSSYVDYIIQVIERKYDPPAVMTTGYEFRRDPKDQDSQQRIAWFASRMDRIVRISTSKVIPWGTYYPEPNLCIRIEDSSSPYLQFPEAFCRRYTEEEESEKNPVGSFKWSYKDRNLESPFILKEIFSSRRGNKKVVFLDKPALITATPKDVTDMLKDQKIIKRVRQNHFFSRNWANSLFINWSPSSVKNKTSFKSNIQSFFSKLDAEQIFVKRSWCVQCFENFEFNSNFEEDYSWDCSDKVNLDDIVNAAKFSQISALLWILAFYFPLTDHDEDKIFHEGVHGFLLLYMKAAFNDDEMAEDYLGMMKFYEERKTLNSIQHGVKIYQTSLKEKIEQELQRLGNPKLPNDLEYFHKIIKDIISAKSPKVSGNSGSHSRKLFDQIQEKFDQMHKKAEEKQNNCKPSLESKNTEYIDDEFGFCIYKKHCGGSFGTCSVHKNSLNIFLLMFYRLTQH